MPALTNSVSIDHLLVRLFAAKVYDFLSFLALNFSAWKQGIFSAAMFAMVGTFALARLGTVCLGTVASTLARLS